jgi:hypothetical protein
MTGSRHLALGKTNITILGPFAGLLPDSALSVIVISIPAANQC